jgi:hypothetical protein
MPSPVLIYRRGTRDTTGFPGNNGNKNSVFARLRTRRTILLVTRNAWLILGAGVFVAAVFIAPSFWKVQKPPKPKPALLPASARVLLQPFRQQTLDLKVPARDELKYQVGMQAGATLVYAWSAMPPDRLDCQFSGQASKQESEAHGAFVAQSDGWYRWRWKNPDGHVVTIHFKLSGYYEPEAVPPASMPYDK